MITRTSFVLGTPLARCLVAILCALLFLIVGAPARAAAQGACPNEQLRDEDRSTALPDCRAYEMVTPPFKNGAVVEPTTSVSVDGSRIAFESFGNFGEPADSVFEFGAPYIDTRGTTGWAALPVEPSASQFQGHIPLHGQSDDMLAANEALSETLFAQVPTLAVPIDARLYRRQLAGPFTEIGPVNSPPRVAAWTRAEIVAEEGNTPKVTFAGATADLSRVFFTQARPSQSTTWFWSGDPTVAFDSLYEYSGTGSAEPALVGVRPQEVKTHPGESPALVSQCGTILGGVPTVNPGPPKETYNAVSAGGTTVFFTAMAFSEPCAQLGGTAGPPVEELYARLDGHSTVAISEPSPVDCAACQTFPTEPQKRGAGVFQGASADGSKVFFLSKQALLPGAAANNLYEYNFKAANPHEKLALIATSLPLTVPNSELAGVVRVAQNGSRVYFVSTAKLAGNSDAKGEEAVLGEDNLYVYDTESDLTTFVATLSSVDSENWSNQDLRRVEATPDGRFLLFPSVNRLTSDATGEGSQLYRYDAQTGQLIRVSVGENGFNHNGNTGLSAEISNQRYSIEAIATQKLVFISNDGSRVFFSSQAGLTPQALDHVPIGVFEGSQQFASNVYEWEAGHVYLLSDGLDAHAVARRSATTLVGADPSGSNVFFTTADTLLPYDTDTQQDLYDARIGGGFAAPVTHTPCSAADACRGAASTPPVLASPTSPTVLGTGNLPSPPAMSAPQKSAPKKVVKCPRGKRLRHAKCVKVSRRKKRAKNPSSARTTRTYARRK